MEERNETAFTPGPWKAFDVSEMHDEPRFMVGPREYCSIAEVRAGSTEAEETGDVAANARLIAAAPALYEALKEVTQAMTALTFEGIDRGKGHWPAWDKTAQAVDRARSALLLANTGGTENER